MAHPMLHGTAFITGAGSGIGQSTAFAFARLGAKNLVLTDISRDNLQQTVEELQKQAKDVEVEAIEMDVSKEDDVKSAIAKAVQRFGRIDYAVNNAGVGGPQKATVDVELPDFQKLMDINLTGVWLCQREEIKQMLKQESLSEREGRGAIINVASMLGTVASSPATGATAYSASKHAVVGLTRTDAVFYASQNIRINAICPGYVATPLLLRSIVSDTMQAEIRKVPMGRLAKMEEIGDSIAFLASPMSSFMCGATLLVDGGYTAQ